MEHVDTIVVLAGILSAVLLMNEKFNEVEKELAMIKTVLVVKGIYPNELCKKITNEKTDQKNF